MSSISSATSLLASAASTSQNSSSSINLGSLLAAATGATTPGIDVNAAVSAAVYALQAPERQWQAQQAALQAQTTALTGIQTAIASVTSDLNSLGDLSGPMSSRTVSSTYSNVATATATAGTPVGNHVVVVNSLASTSSWYSAAASSSSANLGSTQLTIKTSTGSSSTIQIGSGVNTLDQVATAINSQGLGVTASVVNDANGARLALVSNSSGKDADFSVSTGSDVSTSWSSGSVASSTSPLSASTFNPADGTTSATSSFNLSDGTNSKTVTVKNGETLDQLANDINSQGLALTASVVSDSNGAHLQINSSAPSSGFTISADPTFQFTQASQGANASLTVDGIPISSATNTVTGAVKGLTINLLNASFGAQVNLSVAPDASQVSTALGKFVADYNSAIGLVNTQFSFDQASGTQGPLGSDPVVRTLQSTMMQAISYSSGNSGANGGIASLASLGISVQNDGTLALDSTKVANAINNNPSGVQNFFQGTALNGFSATMVKQLSTFTNASNGAFTVDLKSIASATTNLANEISDFETNYIANQKTILTSMYSKAEIALQQLPTQLKQIQAQLGNNSNS